MRSGATFTVANPLPSLLGKPRALRSRDHETTLLNTRCDMFLRFSTVDRVAVLGLLLGLGCSESEPTDGAGGAGAGGAAAGTSSGGMSTGGAGASAGGAGGAGAGGASGASAGGVTGGTGGATGGGGAAGASGSGGAGGAKSKTTFFVTSDKSMTGKLGGLEGADKRCQDLAQAAGIGDHTFRAYLSTSTVNAKDRIGSGPWVNSAGVTLAENLTALHALEGNAELFLDEKKAKINGQWEGSPDPNEHDVLTGSKADGTVQTGMTCMDWTSDSPDLKAQVGHSDGLGPDMNGDPPYNSWNSSHENGSCGDTSPKGGAGRIYCFAID
jgi:hypothetical protein